MHKPNHGNSPSCLVDKYIGSDFDYVIDVSENMEHVETVSTNIEDVKTTSQNIDDIKTIVNSLPTYQLSEVITLSEGQTLLPFTKIVPIGSEFIVTGMSVDDGHLVIGSDYEVFEGTKIRLARSYPAGTLIKGFQVVHKESEITNVIFKNGDPVIVHPIPTETAVSTYTFPFDAWWVADIYVDGKYLDPLKYELNCDTFTLTFNPVIPIGSELIAQVGGNAASINSWVAKLEEIKVETGTYKDGAELFMNQAQASQIDVNEKHVSVLGKHREVTNMRDEVISLKDQTGNSQLQASQSAAEALLSSQQAMASKNQSEASALLSEHWATGTGLVDGVSFSSKGYSETSRDFAVLSQRWSQEVINPIDGIGYGAKYYAIQASNNAIQTEQDRLACAADALRAEAAANKAACGQFNPWDKDRIYTTGEVVSVVIGGRVQYFEMYAGDGTSLWECSNKDPRLAINRKDVWEHATDPWWWTPYTGEVIGSHFWWLSNKPPEWGLNENSADLKATKYWRVAALYPELVSNGLLLLADGETIGSRFIRATTGNVHVKQGDAIRNITGGYNARGSSMITGVEEGITGAFSAADYSHFGHCTISSSTAASRSVSFDASRVVPTSNENRPANISRMSCIHI